jgi:hypothetical protein
MQVYGSSKLALFARYKFALAFENSLAEDYVTEKFYHPLLAGHICIILCLMPYVCLLLVPYVLCLPATYALCLISAFYHPLLAGHICIAYIISICVYVYYVCIYIYV